MPSEKYSVRIDVQRMPFNLHRQHNS